jgi:hypothetical protein
MRDLDLPRGDERELVVNRERVYELEGEDSRTLAAVGPFRVVPEHDLDLPHETVENLHDQRLVETLNLGDGERGLMRTTEGRDLLHSHSGGKTLNRCRCSTPAPAAHVRSTTIRISRASRECKITALSGVAHPVARNLCRERACLSQ